jgi:hypothetical protein
MKVRSRTAAFVSELLLLTSMIGCGASRPEVSEQRKRESEPMPVVEQIKGVGGNGERAASATEENSWVLQGRVIDPEGRPLADVDITTFWSANGVTLEELRMFQREGADGPDFAAKFDANEGQMEPWGLHPTQTDAHGRFSMTMESYDHTLLAIDKERKRGALIAIDPRNALSSVDVKLVPLVRLHGRVRIAATGLEPKDVLVQVRGPQNENPELSARLLARCSSLKSRFEFWLPPGDYQLEAFGHITPPHELAPLQSVTLASGQHDVDSGILELTPAPPSYPDWVNDAKANGTWVDIQKHHGKPAPAWHITDARGVGQDVTISEFKGKWVLLYFWGPW